MLFPRGLQIAETGTEPSQFHRDFHMGMLYIIVAETADGINAANP